MKKETKRASDKVAPNTRQVSNRKLSKDSEAGRRGSTQNSAGGISNNSARFSLEVKGLFQTLTAAQNRRYFILSVLIHVVVLIAFVINWDGNEERKNVTLPKSVSVRAATSEELAAIAEARKKVSEKKDAEKRKRELAKKKEKERLRKKEVERKKKLAEKKRKEKKELAQKKKVEAAKKKKALEEKKRIAAKKDEKEKQLKEEQKRKEDIQKKVEAAKLAADKKRSEDKLRERIEQIKAKQAANQTIESEQNALSKAAAERELTEVEYYMGVIRSRIENRWRVPPRTKGLRVVLRIRLLPTGELAEVSVAKASGVLAFDNSALHAVNNVGTFPVPKDNQIFERNFRVFSMGFTSPDDGL